MSLLLSVLLDGSSFGRLGFRVEAEESMEDAVYIEQNQPTQKAYQRRNTHVVV